MFSSFVIKVTNNKFTPHLIMNYELRIKQYGNKRMEKD